METSAEKYLKENARIQRALRRGVEPERQPGFGALLIDGALPVGHPLEDTQEDRRRLRKRMEGHR